MAIKRAESSFQIGFEELKQRIELAENAEKSKASVAKGVDKVGLKSKKENSKKAIRDVEAFRSMTEHMITLEELCLKFETSLDTGLSSEIAAQKLKQYGLNKLTEQKTKPWYCVFLGMLTGFFALLLWAGSALCLIAYGLSQSDPSNLYLGIVLAVVNLLSAAFSFYQESKSAAIMSGFKDMIPPETVVIRNGIEQPIESSLIVPGDLVKITAGRRIPADLRVTESNSNFSVDNSSLTGESEPLKRSVQCTNEKSPLETKNLAFFGTNCAEGSGKGIVINTGDRTVIGSIANLTNSTDTEMTTLGKEIARFIKMISIVSISIGLAFFFIGIGFGYSIVNNVINAIGIIVANVPEGLLATLTVSLSITAKKMADQNVLVKNLESVETLGSTSCICSDKTGTLTENKMTLVALWYDLHAREVINFERKDVENLGYKLKDLTFRWFQYCATLNNKTRFNFEPDLEKLKDQHGNMLSEVETRKIREESRESIKGKSVKVWPVMGGDASETAMIKFFQPIRDVDEIRLESPVIIRNGVKGEIPFNSANKYAVTIHEPMNLSPDNHKSDCVLFMKGAPEQIWAACSKIMINGEVKKIGENEKKEFEKANHHYGGQGRRVLGFSMLWLDSKKYGPDFVFDPTLKNGPNFPLKDLIFLGLAALEDPPKLRVKEAVESCYKAGIKVIMVTGDQPLTATAIARQVSIITESRTCNEIAEEKNCHFLDVLDESDALVVNGVELSKFLEEDKDLPFEEQRIALFLKKKEVVFARTSPAQKYIIVDSAQKLGHIVAVTGDGVNDSPAIKKADIGIAMAIVGSDVSKDAADMLLMDDNFASIVEGVKEGRKVFDNLKKACAYTLTSNIPELTPFLMFIILQIPLPLSTVLVLCIDLGSDLIPALSLAYEYPELDIMNYKPRNSETDHLVSSKMLINTYLLMGVIQSMAGFLAYFVVMHDYGFPPSTLIFLALNTQGTKPGTGDVYNKHSKYKGNTKVGTSNDGIQVNYISTQDSEYDLRIWYWRIDNWNECKFPDDKSSATGDRVCYSTEALKYAQYAFFVSIVTVQWANLIIVKTRRLSITQHGLRNGKSLYGYLSETILTLLIGFVPGLDVALGGRPLNFLHWYFPALPIFILIIVYEEVRKGIIRKQERIRMEKRNFKVDWVELNTLY